MTDTYGIYGSEDWAREQVVSRRIARQEYRKHGLAEADLIADLGDKPWYSGNLVLNALGY